MYDSVNMCTPYMYISISGVFSDHHWEYGYSNDDIKRCVVSLPTVQNQNEIEPLFHDQHSGNDVSPGMLVQVTLSTTAGTAKKFLAVTLSAPEVDQISFEVSQTCRSQ